MLWVVEGWVVLGRRREGVEEAVEGLLLGVVGDPWLVDLYGGCEGDV